MDRSTVRLYVGSSILPIFIFESSAETMHDLHEEGATREQIEHALVTLPYVRLGSMSYFFVVVFIT